MIYPRVVRYVRTVRNVVAAAVFLVALALYGSRWPWGVALALALGFVARGLTTLLFPLPGTDLELRFDFATRRGVDSLRLASRLQRRRQYKELEWLVTTTTGGVYSVPPSWQRPEFYRLHAELLADAGRTEELAALRAAAAANGALNGSQLDDPAERAAVREVLRARWDSGSLLDLDVQRYLGVLRMDEAYEDLVPVLRKLLADGGFVHQQLADALKRLGREAEAKEVRRMYARSLEQAEEREAWRRAYQSGRSSVDSAYRNPSTSTASWGGIGGSYGGGGGGGGGC